MLTIFESINVSNIDLLEINETKFSPDTVIETLANELFIDNSLILTSFSNYYKKCAPVFCTYTYTQTRSVLFVVTTLLGLIGGLTVVLRFCVFHMVTWWCNRSVDTHEPTISKLCCLKYRNNKVLLFLGVSLSERIRTLWQRVKTLIIEMNLFETAETNSDPFQLITEIITTRVYIVSLCISIAIIVLYASINLRVQSEIIQNPSESIFQTLHDNYESTLHCPCSNITISYGSFISISPVFHPMCTSWLVSEEWIQYLSKLTIEENYLADDFHTQSAVFFRALATLCALAETTVSNAWRITNHSTLITDETLPLKYLLGRSNAAITLFQTSTLAEFKRSLSIIDFHTENILIPDKGNVK
jgi:hypothetical protein